MHAIALLIVAALCAAETRPTAEQVAAAVRASREANTPTQEQAIAAIKQQIDSAELDRAQAATNGRSGRAALRDATKQIADLKQQLRKAEKSWQPPKLEDVELAKLNWSQIKIGDVGRATESGTSDAEEYWGYRCLKIIDQDEALIDVLDGNGDHFTTIKFTGIDTARMQEGTGVEIECDVVVVGRHRYRTVVGSQSTIFEVEVFDPAAPFPERDAAAPRRNSGIPM